MMQVMWHNNVRVARTSRSGEKQKNIWELFCGYFKSCFWHPLTSLPWIIEKKSYFKKRCFDISISGFAGYDAEYTETDRKDIQNLAQEIETKYTQYGEELTQKINPNFGTSTLMSIFRIEERYRVRDWRHIAVVLSGDVPGLVPGQDELQGGGGDRLHAQHSGEQAVTVSLSIKEFSTFIDLLF